MYNIELKFGNGYISTPCENIAWPLLLSGHHHSLISFGNLSVYALFHYFWISVMLYYKCLVGLLSKLSDSEMTWIYEDNYPIM